MQKGEASPRRPCPYCSSTISVYHFERHVNTVHQGKGKAPPMQTKRMASLADLDEAGEPGNFAFLKSETYIAIRLPIDNPDLSLAILPISRERGRPGWYWDGNRDRPTLSPSISHGRPPLWHGYLRNGELVSA